MNKTKIGSEAVLESVMETLGTVIERENKKDIIINEIKKLIEEYESLKEVENGTY